MSTRYKFFFAIVALLIMSALVVTSCTGGIARGWSGGTATADGKTVFAGSMKGKVIAFDPGNNAILGKPLQLTAPVSSGLSCIPSCGGQTSAALTLYASPVVLTTPDLGTVVYVGGNDGKIYAYQFVDNALRTDAEWLYPRQGAMNGQIIGGIIIANNTVYFAMSDGMVYALDSNGLYKKWSYKINSKVWSAPVVDGNTLYIGCFDKTVYALNATDGTLIWKTKTDGSINSTPLIYNNRVYIGDYDRHFYAIDAATGNIVWKFPSTDSSSGVPQNWFWAKPLVLNNVIYAPCLDGNLYALNPDSGNLITTFTFGNSITSSPIVVGNYIVVTTAVGSYAPTKQIGKAYIVNTTDGSHRELDFPQYEDVNAPLFAQGSIVYFHTTKDNLYSVDTSVKDGKLALIFNLNTVK